MSPARMHSNAPSMTGILLAKKRRLTFEARAISRAWPMRPKPVTSVRAWTAKLGESCSAWTAEDGRPHVGAADPRMASVAVLLSVVIDLTAAAIHAGWAVPFFSAVEITPGPSDFVERRRAPG